METPDEFRIIMLDGNRAFRQVAARTVDAVEAVVQHGHLQGFDAREVVVGRRQSQLLAHFLDVR